MTEPKLDREALVKKQTVFDGFIDEVTDKGIYESDYHLGRLIAQFINKTQNYKD